MTGRGGWNMNVLRLRRGLPFSLRVVYRKRGLIAVEHSPAEKNDGNEKQGSDQQGEGQAPSARHRSGHADHDGQGGMIGRWGVREEVAALREGTFRPSSRASAEAADSLHPCRTLRFIQTASTRF